MEKGILAITVALVLLFCSCSIEQNVSTPDNFVSIPGTEDAKTITVDSGNLETEGYSGVNPLDTILVENLDPDKVYGFVVGDRFVLGWLERSEGVRQLEGNVFVLDPSLDSVEFRVADLGISETNVRITFFAVDRKEYGNPMFDTTMDSPVHTFCDGVEVYMGWYDIDMADHADYSLERTSDVVLNGQYNNNFQNVESDYVYLGFDGAGVNDLTGEEFKIVRCFIKMDDKTMNGSDGFAVGRVTFMNTARLEDTLSLTGPMAILLSPSPSFRLIETNVPDDYWIPTSLRRSDNGNSYSSLQSFGWEGDKRIYLVPPVIGEVYFCNDLMHWKTGKTGFDVEYGFELRKLYKEDLNDAGIESVSDTERCLEIDLAAVAGQSQNRLYIYVDSTGLSRLASISFAASDSVSAYISVEAVGGERMIIKEISLSEGNAEIEFDSDEADAKPYMIRFDDIVFDGTAVPEDGKVTITFGI